jgi:molybdopterin-containing oxidoreductase family iron-sulfur binding subunit
METPITPTKYWMSLEQWRRDPEFAKMAETEFLSSPLQSEDGQDGWARREFLKLMGASLALTTFGCVRRPAQKIIPYAKKPADIVHGIPNIYASSWTDGVEVFGTLVTTRDGRPIKIEGNPSFRGTGGGMSARAHSHILKLYDPDRLTSAKRNLQNESRSNRETVNVAWDKLDDAVVEQLKKGKVAMVAATQMSPTTSNLIGEFASAFGAKTYSYDDLGYTTLMEASQASYGRRALPVYNIENAKLIVAVNNDFLGTWITPTYFQHQWGKARKPGANMVKLIAFESAMSMTGTNADQRFRIRPTQSLDVIMALLHEIIVVKKASRYAGDDNVGKALSAFNKNRADLNVNVAAVAEQLLKNRGKSLVISGGPQTATDNAVALQIATNFLNAVLENDGETVRPAAGVDQKISDSGMEDLLNAMQAKEVRTLIIHGCNPAYSLPSSAKFTDALKNVEMVIYTGDRNDETGRMADYLACDHHALENWGDAQSLEGEMCIQQPTIQPLYDTRAMQDSLINWMQKGGKASAKVKGVTSWYEYLRDAWMGRLGGSEDRWVELLQEGVMPKAAAATGAKGFSTAALSRVRPDARTSGFELVLYSTVGLGDGSLANVPWLQEFPDPVTKIVWDNYACFSLSDAKQLKVREGQYVTVTTASGSVSVPAHVQPGQADGVVALALGYGRKGGGRVADGIGVSGYSLANFNNGQPVMAGLEAKVTVEKRFVELACTQDHHSMEGRQIVVEETLAQHMKKPGGQVHRHHITTMWKPHEYKGNKWGMVIDLNSCTGCGSCVIACQSENNIPVVGKRHVLRGREMHWIRIDRYYTGMPEDPGVVHQPLPCMHCENAPCETVCPVAATTHSDEGTNDMIYNRCVGTRYCSNNCPYKVRRFNWFDYTEIVPPRQLALNPEVTVRHRGVMEKCSFCIHRIRYAKSNAKLEDRKLKANEVQTACQQSCPSHAITFGDRNNAEDTVTSAFSAPQSYALLEELNTQPAVRYQVKVRNTDEVKGGAHAPAHGAHEEGGH